MCRIISSWQLDCRPELCQYVTQRSTNLQTSKLHSIHSQPECYGYHGTVEILHITICSSRARVWLPATAVWCFLISVSFLICDITPALATCQPQCECPQTIPPSRSIIHMSDEELGCPRNFRRGNFAHLPKFQGSLQKHWKWHFLACKQFLASLFTQRSNS